MDLPKTLRPTGPKILKMTSSEEESFMVADGGMRHHQASYDMVSENFIASLHLFKAFRRHKDFYTSPS